MKRVTVKNVMSWKPCADYPRERIEELFAGRKSLGWREILSLCLPAKDLLWVFLHPEFLSERRLHLLGCDFAEAVLPLADDPRPAEAIRVKRLWVDGQATDEELAAAGKAAREAAADAADAAWALTWAAAEAAARTAARTAVEAAEAALDAAWDAAASAQLALVIAALEEEENAETAA